MLSLIKGRTTILDLLDDAIVKKIIKEDYIFLNYVLRQRLILNF